MARAAGSRDLEDPAADQSPPRIRGLIKPSSGDDKRDACSTSASAGVPDALRAPPQKPSADSQIPFVGTPPSAHLPQGNTVVIRSRSDGIRFPAGRRRAEVTAFFRNHTSAMRIERRLQPLAFQAVYERAVLETGNPQEILIRREACFFFFSPSVSTLYSG